MLRLTFSESVVAGDDDVQPVMTMRRTSARRRSYYNLSQPGLVLSYNNMGTLIIPDHTFATKVGTNVTGIFVQLRPPKLWVFTDTSQPNIYVTIKK